MYLFYLPKRELICCTIVDSKGTRGIKTTKIGGVAPLVIAFFPSKIWSHFNCLSCFILFFLTIFDWTAFFALFTPPDETDEIRPLESKNNDFIILVETKVLSWLTKLYRADRIWAPFYIDQKFFSKQKLTLMQDLIVKFCENHYILSQIK